MRHLPWKDIFLPGCRKYINWFQSSSFTSIYVSTLCFVTLDLPFLALGCAHTWSAARQMLTNNTRTYTNQRTERSIDFTDAFASDEANPHWSGVSTHLINCWVERYSSDRKCSYEEFGNSICRMWAREWLFFCVISSSSKVRSKNRAAAACTIVWVFGV